jgi:hypothetical protein
MKINRDLPRQTPRTDAELELLRKIEAREQAEDAARLKRAKEVEADVAERSNEQEAT